MSMNQIEYGETAREYSMYRRAAQAAVERLIAGSGIAGTSRVLEVGCGTGNYISEIRQWVGCECWGVDPSPEMIGQARQGNQRVAYGVASAEHLGVDEGAFDFAFSVDVVHHVADRPAYHRPRLLPAGRGWERYTQEHLEKLIGCPFSSRSNTTPVCRQVGHPANNQ
jgi:SAM-dependent methyltransferase